jgi:hypothetical protein
MHADRARFDQLMARFKAAGGEEDRWVYARALSGGRDEQRARELMAASLAGVTAPNIAIALPGLVGSQSPFGALAYNLSLSTGTSWRRSLAMPCGAASGCCPTRRRVSTSRRAQCN